MKGDDSDENKGFVFVTFRSAEIASKAIDELNNTEFKKLGRAGSKEGCAGGLAWSYTDVELVKDAKNPSNSRGFAFVDYHNHACAEYSRQKVKAMYVKNLQKNVTQDQLKKLFEHHGKITKSGSAPRKIWIGKRDDEDAQAKSPHFFKIILADTLVEGKLRVPRKFISKCGVGLSNTAYLKLPRGAEWKVELTDSDGEVWFQNGWHEFANYHSLKQGHLLVLRYEGNSHFYVLIFDASATEIDYSFDVKIQVPKMEDIESDDNCVEILGDLHPSQKTRKKSAIIMSFAK